MANYQELKESLEQNLYFKAKEGENIIRIVTEPVQVWKVARKDNWTKGNVRTYLTEKSVKMSHDEECVPKFLCYLFNRSQNNRLQLAEFGIGIMSKFVNMAVSSKYGFESIPPYDLVLTRTGEKKSTKYELQPDRQDTPLTDDEKQVLASAKSVRDILNEDETVVKDTSGYVEPKKDEIDISSIPF